MGLDSRVEWPSYVKWLNRSELINRRQAIGIVLVALFSILTISCGQTGHKDHSIAGPVKVEVVRAAGKYQLIRGGLPYDVKGAGLSHADMATFARHGGNSVRTWNTGNAQQLLDEAHEYGVTVSLCLWVQHQRHGFTYDDELAIERQLREFEKEVLKYRNHPALLAWIIGNEVNSERFDNSRVFQAVDEISRMVHRLDPNHPTTSALAGYSNAVLSEIEANAPDLDFVSFQIYGDLINLPRYIEEAGYKKPFFITEWGARGHWEVSTTSWGAPIEHTSSEKARNYRRGYEEVLAVLGDQVIGSYVFVWGQKQERTPTWYSMFLATGEETETVDVMHHIWKGQWPSNRAPAVKKLELNLQTDEDNVRLSANRQYEATLHVQDPESDPLSFTWEVKKESEAQSGGGDFERELVTIENLIEGGEGASITLKAPEEEGAYRLYAYAYDNKGHVAHANIPFYVKSK